MSCCDLTEIYSPAAIDAAPEINPATQVTNSVCVDAPLAAIPTTRLVTEIIPSFAPRTAARSQPPRGVLEMRIHQHPLASHHCDALQALEHLKDQTIYLICGTGGRSALAADTLQNMGFTQVKSVQGGYQAWLEQGYPVEK